MKKYIIIFALMVCSPPLWAEDNGSVHSLRGVTPLAAPSVVTASKSWVDGEGKVNRNYPQQPPLIPHNIDELTINQEGNDCLSCHNWNSEMPGATKVAVSHFLTRDNHALANISPRRYFCTQCHVPQRDAKALVKNLFEPTSE